MVLPHLLDENDMSHNKLTHVYQKINEHVQYLVDKSQIHLFYLKYLDLIQERLP